MMVIQREAFHHLVLKRGYWSTLPVPEAAQAWRNSSRLGAFALRVVCPTSKQKGSRRCKPVVSGPRHSTQNVPDTWVTLSAFEREVSMPWKECSVMDERLRFVAKLLDGESMSEVCREFGISRKTGYKIFTRYKDQGLEALTDRSRRPVRYANQLPPQIESQIVALKQEKPHWGARKIRELLVRRLA